MVSVPSRGLIYLNYMTNSHHRHTVYRVSVPSRGLIYLNKAGTAGQESIVLFPSPLGDLYISIMAFIVLSFTYVMFPSPLGDLYISILKDEFSIEL